MDNPEKLSTLDTQDEGAIKNGQSRKTANIGYTRHRTKKNISTSQKTKKMSNTDYIKNRM